VTGMNMCIKEVICWYVVSVLKDCMCEKAVGSLFLACVYGADSPNKALSPHPLQADTLLLGPVSGPPSPALSPIDLYHLYL
jgi:hypothetical protein